MPPRQYWLVKSEPETFSFDDLLAAPGRTTHWDGVRNFAARNHLRAMKKRRSSAILSLERQPTAVVGVAEVAREAYPDSSALDKKDPHFDPKSKPDDPTWFMVDIKAVAPLERPCHSMS
jgi:predicted RNA-binding protein with PUA-like domain